MKDGQFLYYIFSTLGELGEPNMKGEYSVRCPFEHDKGFEMNPSAHVNISKGVFHCKTCLAEGRFGHGGLSEVQFISEYYKVSRSEAEGMLDTLRSGGGTDHEAWNNLMHNLHNTPMHMEMLMQRRGLTFETILEAKLGYSGDGVMYPVFIYGELCDVRTYDPDAKPKMRSRTGATTLMFPFDLWVNDPRPTLLVGGENDALIGRQIGFNALTFTGGEGAVPKKSFLSMFRGKKVYVCYDGDLAGKKGAQRVAFMLKEIGAEVFITDILKDGTLTGEKDDKDLSDYVVKHGKGYAEVSRLMQESEPFSEAAYLEEKNRIFPLVDLWEASEGKHQGRRLSSRVVMAGKYDMDMHVPSRVEFKCAKEDDPDHIKEDCPIHKQRMVWELDEHNLKDVLYLVDVKEAEQTKALYTLNYLSPKDTCVRMNIKSYETVQKVILMPDVESENELSGFRSVEQYAYTVGCRLNDGDKYRAFFKPYPHPKDNQRVYLVIDRIEASDNAVNTFKVTERLKQRLAVFQGHPTIMMQKRFEMAKGIIKGFTSPMMVWGVDLVYHSPMSFEIWGKRMKGYPEVAIVGETRTGKSDTAQQLQNYYSLGNRIALKGATTAGILGGAERMPNGSFRIKWGVVPRNDRGLVIMDEMSGIQPEVLAQITDMRSEGVANINKIISSKAPARTRMLWIGNPRVMANGKSKSLMDYPSGVAAVLDLVGAEEDVSRFDAIMLVVDKGHYVRPDLFSKGSIPHDRDTYVDLIRWIWSRKEEQITFDADVPEFIWHRAEVLNEEFYAPDVKLFGAEAAKKLARFSVACAACCFSCDETGEKLVVKSEHVQWAEYFLRSCYDDDVFRLRAHVAEAKKYIYLSPDVEDYVHKLMARPDHFMLLRELYYSTDTIPHLNLERISGMDRDTFSKTLSMLAKLYLVRSDYRGVSCTRKFRKAYQSFNPNVQMRTVEERSV